MENFVIDWSQINTLQDLELAIANGAFSGRPPGTTMLYNGVDQSVIAGAGGPIDASGINAYTLAEKDAILEQFKNNSDEFIDLFPSTGGARLWIQTGGLDIAMTCAEVSCYKDAIDPNR